MAEAMIAGLLADRAVTPELLAASHPRRERREALAERHGISVGGRATATRWPTPRSWSLAVKPQMLSRVMRELRGRLDADQVVVSIVAGATIRTLVDGLQHAAVVRAMPNTPSQIRRGIERLVGLRRLLRPPARPRARRAARPRRRAPGRRRGVRRHGDRALGHRPDLPVRGDGGAHRRRRASRLPARARARPGGRDPRRLRASSRSARSSIPPSSATRSPRPAAPARPRSTSSRRAASGRSSPTRCGPPTAARSSSASGSRPRSSATDVRHRHGRRGRHATLAAVASPIPQAAAGAHRRDEPAPADGDPPRDAAEAA